MRSTRVPARLALVALCALVALGALAGASQAARVGSTGADLGVVVRSIPFHPRAGQVVTYLATIRNHGPEAASATLTDHVAHGLSLVSVTPSQGVCAGAQPITCSLGTLVPGQEATVRIVGLPTRRGRLADVARVSGDRPDPRHVNNHAVALTGVRHHHPVRPRRHAHLGLLLHGTPLRVRVGQDVTYVATIRAHGRIPTNGITFTNRLPNGMALLSVSPSQGSCTGSAPIRCDLGALANGGRATVTIVARALVPGRRIDVGSVRGNRPDRHRFNNHASAITLVRP